MDMDDRFDILDKKMADGFDQVSAMQKVLDTMVTNLKLVYAMGKNNNAAILALQGNVLELSKGGNGMSKRPLLAVED